MAKVGNCHIAARPLRVCRRLNLPEPMAAPCAELESGYVCQYSRENTSRMARKAKKKVTASLAGKSRKGKSASAGGSIKRHKPAGNAARKGTRRTAAEVAKLRKAAIAGTRRGKTADVIAAELGISRAYVYALKNRA
jgi:hypothetical protein